MKGSTRKRGKTWTAYWWVTDPATGDRRQDSKGGFRTKKLAEAHLTDVLAKIANGTYAKIVDPKLTVERFLVDHWLPSIRSTATKSGEKRRPNTIENYRLVVDSWVVPHLGAVRLAALTPRHVENWLATLAEGGGRKGRALSGSTCQYAFGRLKDALAYGVRAGLVLRNVVAEVGRPGADPSEMQCWSAEEAQQFLRHVEGDRWAAAWVLFLARGFRRGELAGLRWDAIDLTAGTLRVVRTRVSVGGVPQASTPKTAAGRRTIHLDAGLVSALRTHRARQAAERLAAGGAWTDTGHLFVDELGELPRPSRISDRFKSLSRAAGVPSIRLHDARHSAATLMLANGTAVKVASEMLGHADPALTMRTYQHVLPSMAQEAGTALSAMLGIDVDKPLTEDSSAAPESEESAGQTA